MGHLGFGCQASVHDCGMGSLSCWVGKIKAYGPIWVQIVSYSYGKRIVENDTIVLAERRNIRMLGSRNVVFGRLTFLLVGNEPN